MYVYCPRVLLNNFLPIHIIKSNVLIYYSSKIFVIHSEIHIRTQYTYYVYAYLHIFKRISKLFFLWTMCYDIFSVVLMSFSVNHASRWKTLFLMCVLGICHFVSPTLQLPCDWWSHLLLLCVPMLFISNLSLDSLRVLYVLPSISEFTWSCLAEGRFVIKDPKWLSSQI